MKTQEIIAKEKQYGANNYNPIPLVIATGSGAWVTDVEGKRYLDFLAAYSAVNQGHNHPRIREALEKQLDRIALTSRAFHNDLMGLFLEKLCTLTGFEKALPMNTGAEAVETAIKAARKWGYKFKGVPENKAEIIAFSGNFSGRTTTIISFSTEDQYKDGFGPFTPGFVIAEYGNYEDVAKKVNENTVAILIEPVQGEAGVVVPPEGYLKQLRKLSTDNNVLLIADEIQSGFGRTGKFFCYEHDDIRPDVLVVGKALSGGYYPISAVLSDDSVMRVFGPGDHGSTYGGNPLASAIGIAALDVLIDENLTEKSARLGEYLLEQLRTIENPLIKEIRGKGLFVGIELKPEAGGARKYCEKLMAEGVLCKETHDDTIRIAPPLTISKEDLDIGIAALKKVLSNEK
jgi:ornithine--oxo-acid transaminase